jgi:hypothetical protein
MPKLHSEVALDALQAALTDPKKVVGYRGYSRVISASTNFFIARQYRTLNARIVLLMQDDIAELEAELDRLDKTLALNDSTRTIHNGSFRHEHSIERIKILSKLKFRLKEYSKSPHLSSPPLRDSISCTLTDSSTDDYINSYSQLSSKPQVETKDVQSLHNWLNLFEGAIYRPEIRYLDRLDDLIYVTPNPDSSLRRAFGYIAPKLNLPCFRRNPDPEMGYDEPNLMLWNEQHAQAFFTKATMVVGLGMLIGPLWVLEFVNGPLQRLGVITAFVVLFLFLLSVATTARPIESLAGAAG